MIILLPLKFIQFWYSESFGFFIRVTRNLIYFLEEDLGVGIMFKLLFTPLFKDNTIFGHIMSFFFRLGRIILGLGAILLVIFGLFFLSICWYIAPIAAFVLLFSPVPKELSLIFFLILLFGVSLFINEILHKPLKKVWQLKSAKDIFESTKLKKDQITWSYLVSTDDVKTLLTLLELSPSSFTEQNVPLSDDLLEKTYQLAKKTEARFITPAYFWVAMLQSIPGFENALLTKNLHLTDFEGALALLEYRRAHWRTVYIWDDDFAVKHLKGVNRGWLGAPTPNLDLISTDLTREAATVGFPDFVGRSNVVSEVVNILSQGKDRNVLLVGRPGSGRTTLVHYLAKWIVSGDAPASIASKRVVSLDITKLMADVTSEGALAEKINSAFSEVQYNQDIIIYVDEIHNLGVGEAGQNFNLFSLMIPFLESDKFQFISSTEQDSYARIIEKNGTLARLFHKVEVPPATVDDTIKIIQERSIDMIRFKKVDITYLAIRDLVKYSAKLIHDKVLPDSALSVLDECQVAAGAGGIITTQIVKQTLQKQISVPIVEMDSSHKDLLLNLEQVIHTKMIDQEEAVKKVADTLRRSATALREEGRPIGSFLFVGPTGVGKTELAKTLSEVYFKNDGAFLRFDMSEYQTPEAVNRLIGSSDRPGELTEAIKNKPYSLLLLDEFEKANPQILTLFLQVLDDGRLTDFSGNTIDFSNTIIIATSNAASLIIAQGLSQGMTTAQLETPVREELLKVYRPELINRFDGVVIFKPLSAEDLAKIVSIKLQGVARMLQEQGYIIQFTPALISELARKGFDPVLGARPLRRLIQDTLEAKLSRMILENKLQKGEIFQADVDLLQN